MSIKPLVALILLLPLAVLSQTTYVVNNVAGTVANYTNVQAAINAANNGDTIHIQPSETSYGDFTVNKRLKIYGRSHGLKNYTTTVGVITLAGEGSGSEIQAMKISSIEAKDDGKTISDISIYNTAVASIKLFTKEKTREIKNIKIIGNILTMAGDNNSKVYDKSCSNVTIAHNYCTRPFYLSNTSSLKFYNNIINFKSGYLGAPIMIEPGGTIKVSNCIFLIYNDGDDVLNEGLDDDDNGNKAKMIYENCYTYNYNTQFKYDFYDNPRVKLINCKANVNPLFVNYNPKEGFNPDTTDFHLQSNSPVNDAGVYGK